MLQIYKILLTTFDILSGHLIPPIYFQILAKGRQNKNLNRGPKLVSSSSEFTVRLLVYCFKFCHKSVLGYVFKVNSWGEDVWFREEVIISLFKLNDEAAL